jgi:hypothetical protein
VVVYPGRALSKADLDLVAVHPSPAPPLPPPTPGPLKDVADVLISIILNPQSPEHMRKSAQGCLAHLADQVKRPIRFWLRPTLAALNPPLPHRRILPIRVSGGGGGGGVCGT